MSDDSVMTVKTLLSQYKTWVVNDQVNFIKENVKVKVISLIEELEPVMRRTNLNWHEAHVKGLALWKELASCSIGDIQKTSRGNSKLFDFLKAATEFEDILYGLEPYYRDHTLHSLWVYLIGEYVLRSNFHQNQNIMRGNLDWYLFNDIQKEKNRYSYPEILVKYSDFKDKVLTKAVKRHGDAIWCIMALCHDLGYSLEKLGILNDKVKSVLNYFDLHDIERVGYSLDIEHQYLVSQFLELMAMDVRVVPADDYSIISDMEKEDEDKYKKAKANLNKLNEAEIEHIIEDQEINPAKKLDTTTIIKQVLELSDDSDDMKTIKILDEKTLIKCYRDDYMYWHLCRALEKKKHGVLSSYLIYKMLGIFADATVRGPSEVWGLDDDEAEDNIIRGNILFAIAQHEFDFTQIFEFGSLADLLILADELEEFSRYGRPLYSRAYHPTMAHSKVKLEYDDGKNVIITMEYHVEKNHSMIDFFIRKMQRLCHTYSLNEKDEGSRPNAKTIERICMRVRKEGIAYGLSIEMKKADDNSNTISWFDTNTNRAIWKCECIVSDDVIKVKMDQSEKLIDDWLHKSLNGVPIKEALKNEKNKSDEWKRIRNEIPVGIKSNRSL